MDNKGDKNKVNSDEIDADQSDRESDNESKEIEQPTKSQAKQDSQQQSPDSSKPISEDKPSSTPNDSDGTNKISIDQLQQISTSTTSQSTIALEQPKSQTDPKASSSPQPEAMGSVKWKVDDLNEIKEMRKTIRSTLFCVEQKLGDTNYEEWNEEFCAEMRDRYLFKLIDGEWEDSVKEDSYWKELNTKARDCLIKNLSTGMKNYVRSEQLAKAMYDKIVLKYEGNSVMRGRRVCGKLKELMVNRSDNLEKIAMDFSRVVDDLNVLFPAIPNEFYSSLYCNILPAQYDYILSDVQKSDGTIEYKTLVDNTIAAHQRMMESQEPKRPLLSTVNAFSKMSIGDHEKPKSKKKKKKPPATDNQGSGNQTVGNSSNLHNTRPPKHCDYCNKDGHDDSYCHVRARDIIANSLKPEGFAFPPTGQIDHKQNGHQSKASTSHPTGESFKVSAFVMSVNSDTEEQIDPNGIYLDTCAEVSVTNTLEGCIGEVRQMNAVIQDWEGKESRIHGVGNYKYLTETGCSIQVDNVVYKSTATATYLSFGQIMDAKAFRHRGEDGWIEFTSKATSNLVFTARIVGKRILKLEFRPHPDTIRTEVRVCRVTIESAVPTEFMYRFWHNNLGHTSFGYLQKQADLLGLQKRLYERLVCDVCTATKATKLPFPPSDSIAENPFDLVHVDLSGIIRVGNIADVNYFLLLIDDCTRYITLYLLARKYQVPDCYSEYIKWVKVQFNATVKQLRSDNGTEFTNKQMQEQTTGIGTDRQYTAHGNPQQNGRAERHMRTIDQIARALLKHAKLSIRFWPYAVMYAVWLKNRFPHAALDFDSPFFKLFGKLADLRNAKQFGSLWFVVDQESTGKFSDKAVPALFLGYPEGTKGAYVYLIDKRKVDISCHLWPSESAARTRVQTDSTYKIDKTDSDVYMDPNSDYFAKPLYEEERETANDHYMEQLEDMIIEEEDLANYSTCPGDLSSASFVSAHSDLNDTLLVQDDCTLTNIVQSRESEDNQSASTSSTSPGESETARTQQSNEPADSPQPADSAAAATGTEKEELKYLNELIDTKRNDHNEYPKGRIIMNKTQQAWFQTTFPQSKFVNTMPYRGKGEAGKLSIVQVNAINAPKSYEQAMTGPYRHIFKPAMDREMACQYAAKSYTLVKRPPGAQVLPTIWIYKYQYDSCGLIVGGKARLVILGNQQAYELGEQNYAPVVNHTSQRALLSLAVRKGWSIFHIDCTTAFLNSPVKGKIYIAQPRGYVRPGEEHLVGELNRAVYGLRQSARRWFIYLKGVLLDFEFKQALTDSCVFFRRNDDEIIIVGIYVDDIQGTGSNDDELNTFKGKFMSVVNAKDHGQISNFLNVQYKYDRERRVLEIDQSRYIRSILKEADFEHCRTSPLPIRAADAKKLKLSEEEQKGDPDFRSCVLVDREFYRETVGKLMFVANSTRFDFALAMSMLCAHMHDPKIIHLRMLKNFLRYVQRTKDHKLIYRASNDELASQSGIVVYADSSFEENVSRVGMLAFVSGNLVSWTSRKQNRVATSTCESEVLAVHDAVNEVEYLRMLLEELGFDDLVQQSATILNDNLSAKACFETGGKFDKSKHYKNRMNRVIRAVEEEIVTVQYTETSTMLADMLTKPLSGQSIATHAEQIGLRK